MIPSNQPCEGEVLNHVYTGMHTYERDEKCHSGQIKDDMTFHKLIILSELTSERIQIL